MILEYNLQFFAKDGPGGEKTEEPTAKKLDDARKEGQVAKSTELVNGAMLFMFFIALRLFSGYMANGFMEAYKNLPEPLPLKNASIERRGFKAYQTNVVKL